MTTTRKTKTALRIIQHAPGDVFHIQRRKRTFLNTWGRWRPVADHSNLMAAREHLDHIMDSARPVQPTVYNHNEF